MRHKKIYICVLVIAQLLLLCSGCGKAVVAEIPELSEPAAINAAYRPVETGEIGTVEVLAGTVVPVDYCSFYKTSVSISEIVVEVGDYVEAGDVVAYADIAAARKTLKQLQEQLAYENQTCQLNCQISEEEIRKLSYEEEGDREIATLQENQRYDKLLHEYRVEKLNDSIAAQQEIVEDGTLTAQHAGYVTFVKNLTQDLNAGAFENIVIVSDLENTCIELDMSVFSYEKYEDYEEKYLKIGDKTYDVTEIPYSSDELILAKASDRYPNVRLSCPEAGALTIGDTYPVYYIAEVLQNVLIVGNDSIYKDGEDCYVYVKTDEEEKVRCDITIGKRDDHYTEVVSGLSEGDLVYYESDAALPANYAEYTVELSDFEIKNRSDSYAQTSQNSFLYASESAGTIKEIAVEEQQEVSVGDLLYVIDTGEGKAALTQAQYEIDRAKSSYEEKVKNFDEQIAALKESMDEGTEEIKCSIQILSYQKELAKLEYEYNLKELQSSYDAIADENDGEGNVSVYAEVCGVISNISVSEGDRVDAGDTVLFVETPSEDMILVQMKPIENVTTYTDNIADIGEEVTVKTSDGIYTGKCIGWTVNTNNEQKIYPYTDSEGTYLSYSANSGYEYPAFYVKMDDASFYENMPTGDMTFSYISMKNVIVVPSSIVYAESDDIWYVWRIQEGKLVKQYVYVSSLFSKENEIVVLSGIKEGDVLAAGF